MIRQGDLARNFASQICCENAGILCVFQGFRSGFVGEKNRQSPQTQLCGVAFNFTAFYRKRPMPIFAVGYINYGIQGEGPAGGRIIWFDGSHDPTPDRGPISVPTEMGERAAQGAFLRAQSKGPSPNRGPGEAQRQRVRRGEEEQRNERAFALRRKQRMRSLRR